MQPPVDESQYDHVHRVLSLGAGVQSTAIYLMACHGELHYPPELAIFADTGSEKPQTYAWLDELRAIAKLCKIPIVTVSVGDLYADTMKQIDQHHTKPIPFHIRALDGRKQMSSRYCTRDFKIIPIRRYIRRMFRTKLNRTICVQMLGISTDEAHRIKPSYVRYIVNYYPLIELGMTRSHCEHWLQAHGYKVPPRSACFFCPYSSTKSWADLRTDNPTEFAKARNLDNALRHMPGLKGEGYLHNSHTPIDAVADRHAPTTQDDNGFGNECEGLCGL